MFTQSRIGFSLNPRDKILNVINYYIYFFILWFSIVSTFLAYSFSRKIAKYMLDNWRTRVNGILGFSLSNAIRMLVFGAIHCFLRDDYNFQLTALITTETIYVLCLLMMMKFWKNHKVCFKIWFTIIFAVLRILLQFTFFYQQKYALVGTNTKV